MFQSVSKLINSNIKNNSISLFHNYRVMSTLLKTDPELYNILKAEEKRQCSGLELIASENITSPEVMHLLGSQLTNKYSEGLPGKRYYGGNEQIDKIENLCIQRALSAFSLNPEEWGVNVQPYSGSIANLAVYNALLSPHDRLMGLGLPSGGHLTHGFYTAKKKISVSSIYYESFPYQIKEDGYIDYDQLERDAMMFKPKLIICGASAYPRDYDYERFRKIADSVGAYLMADIAHTSGLIATGQLKSPFPFCDVVTTTTHKTLRGPRAAMIFGRIKLMDQINFSVFPSIQGGPHNNQIAAVATQLLQITTPEFIKYSKQTIVNAQLFASEMIGYGYKLVSNGTENHLVLIDLRSHGITGSKVEKLCDMVEITLNKNAVFGDKSALVPGGVRIGLQAVTTRGFTEEDIKRTADLVHQAIQLAIKVQERSLSKKMIDFVKTAEEEFGEQIRLLHQDVREFALSFPLYQL